MWEVLVNVLCLWGWLIPNPTHWDMASTLLVLHIFVITSARCLNLPAVLAVEQANVLGVGGVYDL